MRGKELQEGLVLAEEERLSLPNNSIIDHVGLNIPRNKFILVYLL